MSVADHWLHQSLNCFSVKSKSTNVFPPPALSYVGTQYQARAAAGPGHLAGEPHLTREEWGRPALRSDPAGFTAG